MIRFIAAIDAGRGLANEHGIPWQGKIPSDVAYYRRAIQDGLKLMGFGVYKEISKPFPNGINYVATRKTEKLRRGFENVEDARQFLLTHADEDVWNLGGALLFEDTFDLADELYLTILEGDFECTKFFPKYNEKFEQVSTGKPITENGICFRFTRWKKRRS